MRNNLLPAILIPLLALLLFAPLVKSPSAVLYSDHSDMLAMHLPMKYFSVSSYQETGELPRWCPYSFSGMPFVHDVQVAAFYPLHWPLYWMPSAWIGAGLSWLVVVHVVIAGWAMLAYARWTGLRGVGACVAACGWMLAGKWMLHMLQGGHYILTPLAWLPLVLLLLGKAAGSERPMRVVHRIAWAVGAGSVFGLMVLGTHPQVMFYSGIAVALASLLGVTQTSRFFRERLGEEQNLRANQPSPNPSLRGRGTSTSPTQPRLSAWTRMRSFAMVSGLGLLCAVTAVGVGAIQLLPAIEATPLTSRATGVPSSDVLMGGMRTLVNLVGPAIIAPGPNVHWEDRGGLALLWVLFAVVAIALRKDASVSRHAWFAGLLILFALGGAVLVQWLPGFRLFRQPSRMMLIAALPVAWLAGAGLEAIPRLSEAQSRLCQKIILRLIIAVGILSGGLALRSLVSGESLLFHPYWISLAVTVPFAYWLFSRARAIPGNLTIALATVLLLFDLSMIVLPAVAVRSADEIYPETRIAQKLKQISKPGERILERDESTESLNSPLGTGAPLAMLHRLEAVRGYNSFDVAAYRQLLKRISCDDSPLAPFDDPWTFPLIGNFPLQDRSLLNLLGVRYLVQPAEAAVAEDWQATSISEEAPRAYNLIDGGVRTMTAYSVFENQQAFPRAFAVGKQDVRLDDSGDVSLDHCLEQGISSLVPATLKRYSPNRVELAAEVAEPSFLVLTDAFYPGWQCEIDGRQAPILRAERLFRAVELDAGRHEVVFDFEPSSLRIGRAVSTCSVLFVVAVLWFTAVEDRRRRSQLSSPPRSVAAIDRRLN